jgi:hypothetical protein
MSELCLYVYLCVCVCVCVCVCMCVCVFVCVYVCVLPPMALFEFFSLEITKDNPSMLRVKDWCYTVVTLLYTAVTLLLHYRSRKTTLQCCEQIEYGCVNKFNFV